MPEASNLPSGRTELLQQCCEAAQLLPCRCQKPAQLQCPKCQELGLPKTTSAFCSQDCFKVCCCTVCVHEVFSRSMTPSACCAELLGGAQGGAQAGRHRCLAVLHQARQGAVHKDARLPVDG